MMPYSMLSYIGSGKVALSPFSPHLFVSFVPENAPQVADEYMHHQDDVGFVPEKMLSVCRFYLIGRGSIYRCATTQLPYGLT